MYNMKYGMIFFCMHGNVFKTERKSKVEKKPTAETNAIPKIKF